MDKTIVSLIAGALILWGIIQTIKTIDNYEFNKIVKITLFLFVSTAIGLFLIDRYKSAMVVSDFLHQKDSFNIFVVMMPAMLPFALRLIQDIRFKSAIKVSLSEVFVSVTICFLIFVFIKTHSSGEYSYLAYLPYWLSMFVCLGLLHAIFGPVIARINIALLITSSYQTGVFDVTIDNIFDILSMIGITSEPIQWLIFIISTILGLHDQINLERLQDKFI